MRSLTALLSLMVVSACIPSSNPPASSIPPQRPTSAPPERFRPPPTMRGFGIDTVVGQTVRALTNRFGETRIDLTEGDARKLQFVSERCVLDVFLYPRAPGGEPVASHVEARERGSGADIDRATCIADVERAAQ